MKLNPTLIAAILLGVTVIGTAGFISIGAITHRMDIPTFISSWSTPQILVSDLAQGKLKPVLLIDVRSPEEFAEDRIGRSQLVPLTEIETGLGISQVQKIAQQYEQKHQTQPTIVLYCTSGMRSTKAYKLLAGTGLKFVVLTGGIEAWRRDIPAVKDAGIFAKVE
ncbi:rhodanese-like domain-containing protein [Tumidithrix elongata RA019]|uniref:Rhodanese-like domain-containing protein n=1 Tax=Tumidithrix elongata BACA0141 TaxID=2716417 RepID=A0AAW9Q3M9_9CYAN|nr:rhodanese-like domain-containing protein [Tumidithrix elongata RA019]